jgi:glycosidase
MRQKLFIILMLAALAVPLSASAFWFWDKPAKTAPSASTSAVSPELTAAEKEIVAAKYKTWADSFEKNNIASVIANQDNFFFTAPELNYLFATETKKQKYPILTDFKLTIIGDVFNISANFKEIFTGHFSFQSQIINENNKAHLNLSKVRLYGFPIPSSWLSGPLNKAIDEYFAFLYADSRYNGFSFTSDNGILKFKPEFK